MQGVRWSEDDLKAHQARMGRTHPVPAAPACVSADAPVSRPKRGHPEDDLQRQVAEFLDLALPHPLKWLHIPNGGKRDPVVAAILKAFGTKEGAADCLILGWMTPEGRPTFIWIELKSPTGSLSPPQREWRDWCRSIGAPWFLCRSLDDVIAALTSLEIRLRVRAQ
jgi:hypothetical protein